MGDFQPRRFPKPEFAAANGWRYQVDWQDGTNVCFRRCKTLEEAERYATAHLAGQRHYIREISYD